MCPLHKHCPNGTVHCKASFSFLSFNHYIPIQTALGERIKSMDCGTGIGLESVDVSFC